MAIYKHTAGSFKVEASALNEIVDFSVNVTVNVADTTPIGVTWAENTELGKSWTMSITCNYDPDDTAQTALITAYTTGDALLTSIAAWGGATSNYAGSALITAATITKSVGSPDKFTATFTGRGTLSYT